MMGELERTARRIAAETMGLVKDPEGLKLPDDLWQQALPRARKEHQEQASVTARVARLENLLKRYLALGVFDRDAPKGQSDELARLEREVKWAIDDGQ